MGSKKIYNLIIVTLLITMFLTIFNNSLLSYLNSYIWAIASTLIFISGIYFSRKYNFIQVNIKKIIKQIFNNNKTTNNINSIDSLSLTLAAKIGVGSLSGIALAIYYGGPGSIFCMWISSILTSINVYVESILSKEYQQKDNKNNLVGGPSYYIKNGLKNNKLSILYAIVMLVLYSFLIIIIQSNTIITSINTITNINKYILIILLVISVLIIIINDVNKITKVISKIVPIMGIIYIFIGMIVILKNHNIIVSVFLNIIKSAFNIKTMTSSFVGTIIIGIQRGIFASEAGIGTSAIAVASNEEKKEKDALMQVLGIHFTTLIICTLTAVIVLTSNYNDILYSDINGIEIILSAFKYHFGNKGLFFLSIITFLFAFSTIISGYLYGNVQLKFLNINKTKWYKLIYLIIISLSIFIKVSTVWNLTDILVAILAIINITTILKLKK